MCGCRFQWGSLSLASCAVLTGGEAGERDQLVGRLTPDSAAMLELVI